MTIQLATQIIAKEHFQNVNTRVSFENLQKQRNFDVRIHEVGFFVFFSPFPFGSPFIKKRPVHSGIWAVVQISKS